MITIRQNVSIQVASQNRIISTRLFTMSMRVSNKYLHLHSFAVCFGWKREILKEALTLKSDLGYLSAKIMLVKEPQNIPQ